MPVIVIDPPQPIVAPADIPGLDASDPFATAVIAAATGEIDGPNGWLGRCLGVQKLRVYAKNWRELPCRLPYPPLKEVKAIKYFDRDHSQVTLEESSWFKTSDGFGFSAGFQRPPLAFRDDAVCVEYSAGYDGVAVSEGGTGPVPPQARVAIIMAVSQIRGISSVEGQIKVDFVEGIGRTEYAVDEAARKIVTDTASKLLSGLKVYR